MTVPYVVRDVALSKAGLDMLAKIRVLICYRGHPAPISLCVRFWGSFIRIASIRIASAALRARTKNTTCGMQNGCQWCERLYCGNYRLKSGLRVRYDSAHLLL